MPNETTQEASALPTQGPQDEEGLQQSRALVKLWQSRIVADKARWKSDFERMRKNMEFVAGLQWPNQTTIDTERYVCNLVKNLVSQKVSNLYAKDPSVSATRRRRMDYTIWDGEMESLMEASAAAHTILPTGQPLPIDLAALFADIENGRMREQLVKKVGETLEIVYKYYTDAQKPEFKQQAKQAVRRGIITGVAYARPIFCRDAVNYSEPSTIDYRSGPKEREQRAATILAKIGEGAIDTTSATMGTLRSLAMSLGTGSYSSQLPERLEFDFPPATSIIPDQRCRSLVDFVGARWVTQEYVLPVEDVNSLFDVDVKITGSGGEALEYEARPDLQDANPTEMAGSNDIFNKGPVCLYEVFDYGTGTRFFICQGWKDFILAPEVVTPSLNGFWHHFALVFNETESEAHTKTSIFPMSDVQAVKSAQLEWNRTRNALRDQRNANAPKYIVRKGFLTDDDKRKLQQAEPNSVIELEGVPPEQPLDKFILPFQFAGIDPNLYDTTPLEQDLMLGGGMQQANIGPAQPNVTATVGSIAEQSRLNVSASNIDDLDGFLSRLAQAGGEMLLQELSPEIAKRIAGPGAVWPSSPETRQDFLNEIFLEIKAASSGRPNKAMDIANWRDLFPVMQAAGANPVGMVKETAKRLDDNMDVLQFFPLLPPAQALTSEPAGQKPKPGSQTDQSNAGPASTLPSPALVGGNDGATAPQPSGPVS